MSSKRGGHSDPYRQERFRSRSPQRRSPYEDMAKKKRREPERYPLKPSMSPPRQRPLQSSSSDGRMFQSSNEAPSGNPSLSQRDIQYIPFIIDDDPLEDVFSSSDRGRISSTHPPGNSKKAPSSKSRFEDSRVSERFRSASPVNKYPTASEKRSGLSLHERFSGVGDPIHDEPRIRYSREDLEKITIDIRRNIVPKSPTRRAITNPADVKLVRRPREGDRQLFDKDEIKHAPKDMRKDAYYERKMMTNSGFHHALRTRGFREIENYKITRHRFDERPFHSTKGRLLSERWRDPEEKREDRLFEKKDPAKEYERVMMKKGDVKTVTNSGDLDFRAARFSGKEVSHIKPTFADGRRAATPGPTGTRMSAPMHHKDNSHQDVSGRQSLKRPIYKDDSDIHSSTKRQYISPPHKIYPPTSSVKVDKRRSPISPPKWSSKKRSESRDRSPDYSRKPVDKYYKSWPERSDDRGSKYYDRDNREYSNSYRGRGTRPFRGGFRARGFRGPYHGNPTYRGSSYRGSNFRTPMSSRGRFSARRSRVSPRLWKHDLYSHSPSDRKPSD